MIRIATLAAATVAVILGLGCAGRSPEPEQVKKGQFGIRISVAEIVGRESAHYFDAVGADEIIEWAVFVPRSYDATTAAGLMVYVSPAPSGQVPPAWRTPIADHNLIWIAANNSGNDVAAGKRGTYALLGRLIADQMYRIDKARIYVSGFSGGGRIASIVAAEHADLFNGAIYNSGANFLADAEQSHLDFMRRNRYVFISGTGDFNLRDTRLVHNSYKNAGIENIKLIVINGMGHENPDARHFSEA
ncbi:MAG: hypothetical protein O7H39_16370, partial [Gammaproteobacteria bacterium]|nr:hypothetical protein [Gammaproteobacteria bacterium]